MGILQTTVRHSIAPVLLVQLLPHTKYIRKMIQIPTVLPTMLEWLPNCKFTIYKF